MGDDKLPLADVNTENVEVIQALQTWIHDFVAEFGVDGLRIDGESPYAGRTEVRLS
jgi:alpha-amylase